MNEMYFFYCSASLIFSLFFTHLLFKFYSSRSSHQVEFQVKETSLDFTKIRTAAMSLFNHRGDILRQGDTLILFTLSYFNISLKLSFGSTLRDLKPADYDSDTKLLVIKFVVFWNTEIYIPRSSFFKLYVIRIRIFL
jgi:hypothetical protein